MTRKDYKLIADAVNEARLLSNYVLPERAIELVAQTLATALAKDNPRFDMERFIEACGFIY